LINHVHWIAETVVVLHPSEFLAVEYSGIAARDGATRSSLLV